MALYNGKAAKEATASYSPGLYKFKITEASLTDWGAVNYKMDTKSEDGNEGPKVFDSLRLNSQADSMLAEVDRRLTTILGKVSIDSPDELVGKVGHLVLRQGAKYLEPMTFGGYFDGNKLSATGNKDSVVTATKNGIEYDWKQDDYAVKKYNESQGHLASVDSATDDGTEPF